MAFAHDIRIKKKFGQHFLRDAQVTRHMIEAVKLDSSTSVFEIGCGDGFLTRSILGQPLARLWIFEIDPEWVAYIKKTVNDERMELFLENFLDVDFSRLEPHKPWTVLANLPYLITFPILHAFQKNRHMINEGVIMIQEEVAQKLTKSSGRGYGYPSLFFQRYFELKLLDRVGPGAFVPPPKVVSRLVYFKTRANVADIPDEEGFWQFIKVCFKQPRRTLRNNLEHSAYAISALSEDMLKLRAQQMAIDQLLAVWDLVRR